MKRTLFICVVFSSACAAPGARARVDSSGFVVEVRGEAEAAAREVKERANRLVAPQVPVSTREARP